MPTKTAAGNKRRRTTSVPVTTLEEIPVLSPEERASLRASLEQAEARIGAGKGIEYHSDAFKKRLVQAYRRAKR